MASASLRNHCTRREKEETAKEVNGKRWHQHCGRCIPGQVPGLGASLDMDKRFILISLSDLIKVQQTAHYQVPATKDTLPDLAEAKIASALGAKDKYWLMLLDKESNHLTTSWTPAGSYRWWNMLFWMKPAVEEYLCCQQDALTGLTGIRGVDDGILQHRCRDTKMETVIDHNLICLLWRAKKINPYLNTNNSPIHNKNNIAADCGIRPRTLRSWQCKWNAGWTQMSRLASSCVAWWKCKRCYGVVRMCWVVRMCCFPVGVEQSQKGFPTAAHLNCPILVPLRWKACGATVCHQN